jgi:hypothetical protein
MLYLDSDKKWSSAMTSMFVFLITANSVAITVIMLGMNTNNV